jgi:predicted house-cleaning noncanonical NTP pyrophosphatase (MazG superfamily)
LLVALGDNRNKLIKKMDLELLAKTCNDTDVEVKQFESLAQLLKELEDYRNELIKELNIKKLADAANAAEINQFEQISVLLKAFGQSKIRLSELLDHNTLVQKAKQAGLYDIRGLTMLMAGLEEEDRNKYIREVDWSSVCLNCPVSVYLLSPLGASLENLWKQDKILPNRANIERVTRYLRDRYANIKEEIGKVNPKLYSGAAKFLKGCNQFDPALAKQIATQTMDKLVQTFGIAPTEYQGAGRLIDAFYAIDLNLSALFLVGNKNIRDKIQQSINEDNWSKEIGGLKYLIEAFYRSAPEFWKKTVSRLTVDLSSLDLNSIYDEVDKEKNAGTACNL